MEEQERRNQIKVKSEELTKRLEEMVEQRELREESEELHRKIGTLSPQELLKSFTI